MSIQRDSLKAYLTLMRWTPLLKRFSKSFGTTSILENALIARNISKQSVRKDFRSFLLRKMHIQKMHKKATLKLKTTMIPLKMIKMNLVNHSIRQFWTKNILIPLRSKNTWEGSGIKKKSSWISYTVLSKLMRRFSRTQRKVFWLDEMTTICSSSRWFQSHQIDSVQRIS